MPVINIQMTKEDGGASDEQKQKLQKGITNLFEEIFGRGGKSAVVIIQEIDMKDYFIGGKSVFDIRKE